MRLYRTERELVLLGGFCMFFALFFEFLTFATRDYRPILLTALLFTTAADTILGLAYYRGSFSIRFWSVIIMFPTLFILVDFIRRVPYAFGR